MFGRKRHHAGLSIEGGSVRYLELTPASGGFRVSRSAKEVVDEGAVAQDRIIDMERLQSAIGGLKTLLGGKFAPSLAVGLPPQDAVIRVVEMPKMSVEDARSAFGWDFEKYFSFPLKDATYDLVPVEVPSQSSETNMNALVVASRATVVNGILEMMAKEGVRVTAIEPVLIAIVRGVVGNAGGSESGRVVLSVGAKSSQIILEYKGNGLVYRTVYVGAQSQFQGGTPVYEMLMGEVRSSIVFGNSQFRGLNVNEIVLCGEYANDAELKTAVQAVFENYKCRVADPFSEWSIQGTLQDDCGWEAAIGLAVRDKS